MPWIKPLKKPQWRMCQLTNFGVSNEEMELKLESTRKTEQDRPYWKIWLLVKGQRKKSKSTSPGQSQRILVRVGSGFSGRVTGRAVDLLTSSYDVSLTWRCLRGCWRGVMTSSYDVRWHQQQYRRVVGACKFTDAWRSSQRCTVFTMRCTILL